MALTTTVADPLPVGADEQQHQAEKWLQRLRKTDSEGAEAFDRLVNIDGCDARHLTICLMELDATRRLKPMCKRDAKSALSHVMKAATSIKKLSNSDLRVFLDELSDDRSFRVQELVTALDKLGLALEKII